MSQRNVHDARILVVDDDAHVRDGLALALELSGYQVDKASNGGEALAWLETHSCDLMVLDMQMPGIDGVEVMRRARPRYPDLAIIVLTGHATLESAITAVKTDAVDYILKPTSVHDIRAAVARTLAAREEQRRQDHALWLIGAAVDALRKQEDIHLESPDERPASELHWGPLTLDLDRRSATIDSEPPRTVDLSDGETDILATLMTHPDEVLSPVRLVHATWGYETSHIEALNVVRSHIYRLRCKLDADADAASVIRTVRGRGYCLAAPDNP